jgi:hypothetical protein
MQFQANVVDKGKVESENSGFRGGEKQREAHSNIHDRMNKEKAPVKTNLHEGFVSRYEYLKVTWKKEKTRRSTACNSSLTRLLSGPPTTRKKGRDTLTRERGSASFC